MQLVVSFMDLYLNLSFFSIYAYDLPVIFQEDKLAFTDGIKLISADPNFGDRHCDFQRTRNSAWT